jgi:hypothetical protein
MPTPSSAPTAAGARLSAEEVEAKIRRRMEAGGYYQRPATNATPNTTRSGSSSSSSSVILSVCHDDQMHRDYNYHIIIVPLPCSGWEWTGRLVTCLWAVTGCRSSCERRATTRPMMMTMIMMVSTMIMIGSQSPHPQP